MTVALNDVSMGGLSDDTYPFNYLDGLTNCSALNAKTPGTCAWASLKLGNEWVNATITVKGAKVILTAVARSSDGATTATPTASAYAWGSIPLMNLCECDYRALFHSTCAPSANVIIGCLRRRQRDWVASARLERDYLRQPQEKNQSTVCTRKFQFVSRTNGKGQSNLRTIDRFCRIYRIHCQTKLSA